MAEEQQLRLDLEEMRHLQSIAKRPRVISFLASEIRDLDAKVRTEKSNFCILLLLSRQDSSIDMASCFWLSLRAELHLFDGLSL